MNEFTFTADYRPGQKVTITALERPGTVELVRFGDGVVDYFVSWWDEGKHCTEWLHARELRP